MKEEAEYISVKAAAKRLGVTVAHLYNLVNTGLWERPLIVRVGRKNLRINKQEFEKFIEQGGFPRSKDGTTPRKEEGRGTS